MKNNLYFIPLISKALVEKPIAESLLKVFETIASLGEKPEYRKGYDQFLKFMAIALKTPKDESEQLSSIWQDLFIQDVGKETAEKRSKPIDLYILKEGEPLATIPVLSDKSPINVANVSPGFYVIELSTGRRLWEGSLTKEDLLWTHAYLDSDIKMAADTEDEETDPIRVIELLGGDVIIQIFPGLESGTLQVKVK